jgi:hypothetical protein
MRQNLTLRIPLERDADELGLIPVCPQLLVQGANVVLGAAMDEGTWTSQTTTRRIRISARAFYIAEKVNYPPCFKPGGVR